MCCYQSDLVSLYNRLDLLPPTRFVYVQELMIYFPGRRNQILAEIAQTPHRFIVTDVATAQLPSLLYRKLFSAEYQTALKKAGIKRRPYPWGYPLIYQSGNYLVHQIPAQAGASTK